MLIPCGRCFRWCLFTELAEIERSTSLGTRAGQALPPKRLRSHHRANLVTVDIDIANVRLVDYLLDPGVYPCMQAEGKTVAVPIDVGQHLFYLCSCIRCDMQYRSKDFTADVTNTRHFNDGGPDKVSFSGNIQLFQQPPCSLLALTVTVDLCQCRGINDRADIGRNIKRISQLQFIHCTEKQFQHPVLYVLLEIKDAKRGTTLAGTLKSRDQHITYHLFGQRGGIHQHRVDAARLSNQRCCWVTGQGHTAVNMPSGFDRTRKTHAIDTRACRKRRADGLSRTGQTLQNIFRDTRLVHQFHCPQGHQGRLFCRLGDNTVSGGKRSTDLAAKDRQRKIPR